MGGKRANQNDVTIGQRIRVFRMQAKMSQTELADKLGVTFQQVQKYEKGTNRVGSGRLPQLAAALGVPITAFFEGMSEDKRARREDRMGEFMTNPRMFKLVEAFSAIEEPEVENAILRLVRAIAKRRPAGRK